MKLMKIDELLLPNHHHLAEEDNCYFLMTYTPGMKWDHSDGNGVIANLKKHPSTKNTTQWIYKEKEIKKVAWMLQKTLPTLGDLSKITFVPIPPSKAPESPEYDDRMAQVLSLIDLPKFEYRELLFTAEDRGALHGNSKPRDIQEIADNISIEHELLAGVRENIVLVDDMITTGASFCACRQVLQAEFPHANYSGLFVTRRQPRSAALDFDDLFFE